MRKSFLIFPLLLLVALTRGFGKAPPSHYLVERVIDGDTIKLSNGERVRYLEIDTPETKHPKKPVQYFGPEAYEANRGLVEGKVVRLEFGERKQDKYGRLLAYVYVDDVFVNAWLVENGYARVLSYPPNDKYRNMLLWLQWEASEDDRGMWAD